MPEGLVTDFGNMPFTMRETVSSARKQMMMALYLLCAGGFYVAMSKTAHQFSEVEATHPLQSSEATPHLTWVPGGKFLKVVDGGATTEKAA